MSLNKKCNKLYLIIKNLNNNDNKDLSFNLKKISIFKSIGCFYIDDKTIYYSFNFKSNSIRDDLDSYIERINNILTSFNIKTDIYYNHNGLKKLVYKCNKEINITETKVKPLFIDDDD